MALDQDKFSTPPPAIAGYSILEELGRGGMGVVYKALQLPINRVVALKIVVDRADVPPDDLVRFLIEGELLARLQHPNIVQIYEVGKHALANGDARPYMAMEFINGGTLRDQIDARPVAPEAAGRMVVTLARAMHYAHERGVVHRDLKPSNVLMTRDGTPKITDFGLAKQLRLASDLTDAGFVVGTPEYMAPEQARGKVVGPASDIHALGMILYEMLTGKPPFAGDSDEQIMQLVARLSPTPPSRLVKTIPPDLEVICLKCLAKRPSERYPSAAALADDLEHFLAGRDIVARQRGRGQRLRCWFRENRLTAALAALVLFLLPLTAIVTLLYLRADADRRRLANWDAALQHMENVEAQVKLFSVANMDNGEALFGLAKVLAAASAAAQSPEAAEKYARLAIDALRQARRDGFFDQHARVEGLQSDAVFGSLRGREDYRRLLQELSH